MKVINTVNVGDLVFYVYDPEQHWSTLDLCGNPIPAGTGIVVDINMWSDPLSNQIKNYTILMDGNTYIVNEDDF